MRLPLLQFTVPQLYGLDDYPNRVVVWPPPQRLSWCLPFDRACAFGRARRRRIIARVARPLGLS